MSRLIVNQIQGDAVSKEIEIPTGHTVKVEGVLDTTSATRTVGNGEIIEQLTAPCDGRTVTGIERSYTWPNVTGRYTSSSTSYADLPGSSISYTAPAGTKKVIYDFYFKFGDRGYGGISHHEFHLAGSAVTSRRGRRTLTFSYDNNNQHAELMIHMNYVIEKAASDDVDNLKLANLETANTYKIRSRNYDGGYMFEAHKNTWWNGTGASGDDQQIVVPTLTMTAIG